MKKVYLLFITMVMVLSLTSCTKGEKTTSANTSGKVEKIEKVEEVEEKNGDVEKTENYVGNSVFDDVVEQGVDTKIEGDYGEIYFPRIYPVGTTWENESGYIVTAYEDFNIAVQSKDIYMSPDLGEKLSRVIAVCEEVTGLQLNPQKLAFNYQNSEYPTFYFNRRYGGHIEYSTAGDVYLYEEEAALGELSDEYSTVIHETLHAILARNCCMYNSIFSEGYAEYYTEEALKIWDERYGTHFYQDDHKNNAACMEYYGRGECGLSVDFTEEVVDIDTIKEYFFLHPYHGGHEPSYYIVAYFVETYGEEELYKIFSEIGKRSQAQYEETGLIDCPNGDVMTLLYEYYSESFVEDFYKWFLTQKFDTFHMLDYDYSDKAMAEVEGYFLNLDTSGEYIPRLDAPDKMKVNQGLTIDYSSAIKLGCEKYQLDYIGMHIVLGGDCHLDLYDLDNNLIFSENVVGGVNIPTIPVAKIVITCNGIQDIDIWSPDNDQFTVNHRWENAIKSAIKNKSVNDNEKIVLDEPYTIEDYLNIYGSLTTEEDGIVFNGGYFWLGGYKEAVWQKGDIELKTNANEFFDASIYSYWPAFRLEESDGKIMITCGCCTDLFITLPEGKKFADYFIIGRDYLYEHARIFVNGEEIE